MPLLPTAPTSGRSTIQKTSDRKADDRKAADRKAAHRKVADRQAAMQSQIAKAGISHKQRPHYGPALNQDDPVPPPPDPQFARLAQVRQDASQHKGQFAEEAATPTDVSGEVQPAALAGEPADAPHVPPFV